MHNTAERAPRHLMEALPELNWHARPRSVLTSQEEARFRRYGIYTQRPAEDGFFMLRIRIPGGDLSPVQLEAIADLAIEHGRGLVDITVRQNMQLHWVRPQSLPQILDRLDSVGLSTAEPFGDTARNIVNCPVAGVDQDELYDTTDIIREVSDFLAGNPSFCGLPRKLKITITGCALLCVYPEISDIGIFAVPGPDSGRPVFRARVGGGLSTSPRFGRDLGIIIEPPEVVDVCAAIADVLRRRAHIRHATPGPCFKLAESELAEFRSQVESRIGRTLARSTEVEAQRPTAKDRTHVGIHDQQTEGIHYVGLSIPGGRTSGAHLNQLARLALQYGSGRIRTTNTQNIILLDIPQKNLTPLLGELSQAGLEFEPHWARKGMLACTGIEFCKLALTETKHRAADLGRQLEQWIDLEEPIRISVTGCPNSCGQHRICDVGLEGSLTTVNGVKEEAFQVFLGGGVGGIESFGRRVGPRIPADQIAGSLVGLFQQYKALRSEGESFQDFCGRHTDAALAAFLHPVDLPPDGGSVPAGQEQKDSEGLPE